MVEGVYPGDLNLVWDLIQEGCGYPNRNKAWKGVPVQVPSAGQFQRGKILLKAGFQNLKLGIRLRQSNFENPTQNFAP